jgi:hypothetical protein
MTDSPTIAFGDLVPQKYQKYRDAVNHLGLAVEDLCR